MSIRRITASRILLLTTALLLGLAWAVAGTQATVLTNLGGVADGTLTGLSPVLELRAPDEVRVIGPMQQYNIPISSILQISLDFPRVVIETETGVIIGPYSAFQGIAEILSLTTATGTFKIPVTSVRAIALHGRALKAVPREWLGDRFLSEPEIVAAAPLHAAECEDCTITTTPSSSPSTTTSDDSTPIWNTITPDTAVEEPAQFPWWIGLIGVAALVVLLYFLGSSQSST